MAPARRIPNNLPAERDVFVGRVDPLQALAALLDGPARLVTVLGIGGIGKTRLVLRHARAWLGDYPGGVWFCDLSTARGNVDTNIRRAMIYGSVVASFCCEGFGLNRTTRVKRTDIDKRVKELEQLTKF